MKASTAFLILALGVICLASGCTAQGRTYTDIADATASGAFNKGWLPDVLPKSSRDIKLAADVESATGHGSFGFNKSEYARFVSSLSAYDGVLSKNAKDNESIKRRKAAGWEGWIFSSGFTRWVFFCEEARARCDFFVWQ